MSRRRVYRYGIFSLLLTAFVAIAAFNIGYWSTRLSAREPSPPPRLTAPNPAQSAPRPATAGPRNIASLPAEAGRHGCIGTCARAAIAASAAGVRLTAPGLIVFNAKYPPPSPLALAVGASDKSFDLNGGVFAPGVQFGLLLTASGYGPPGGGNGGGPSGTPPGGGSNPGPTVDTPPDDNQADNGPTNNNPGGGGQPDGDPGSAGPDDNGPNDNGPTDNGPGDSGPLDNSPTDNNPPDNGNGGDGSGGNGSDSDTPPIVLPPMLDDPGEGEEPPVVELDDPPATEMPIETPVPASFLLFASAIAGFTFARRGVK